MSTGRGQGGLEALEHEFSMDRFAGISVLLEPCLLRKALSIRGDAHRVELREGALEITRDSESAFGEQGSGTAAFRGRDKVTWRRNKGRDADGLDRKKTFFLVVVCPLGLPDTPTGHSPLIARRDGTGGVVGCSSMRPPAGGSHRAKATCPAAAGTQLARRPCNPRIWARRGQSTSHPASLGDA